MKLAIFDFDGTLFPKETFPLLMNHLKTHPNYHQNYRHFITGLIPVYVAYKCKLCPEKTMKEYSMRRYLSSFKSTSKEEINQFFYELGDSMSTKLSDSVVQRLEQHRKDGYYIMLVSGAFEPLLHSVTKNISFDRIIGTSIPFNLQKGKQVRIDPIQGYRKKEVVQEQFSNVEVDWANSYAYGDSYSDLDVLELVGNPVAVKPDSRLSEVANNRKWEMMV
ncbi:HAD family hydrolase [Mesobacillus maritimus]|uniref:HAD family hydrolase n=1 Tax=Mesobacillus maritimus TaxID=1643336 RepID=UPI00384D7435